MRDGSSGSCAKRATMPARERAAALREALGLWRGTPLSDLAYWSFAQDPIRRLEERRVNALEMRLEAELELGLHRESIGELDGLAREHPDARAPALAADARAAPLGPAARRARRLPGGASRDRRGVGDGAGRGAASAAAEDPPGRSDADAAMAAPAEVAGRPPQLARKVVAVCVVELARRRRSSTSRRRAGSSRAAWRRSRRSCCGTVARSSSCSARRRWRSSGCPPRTRTTCYARCGAAVELRDALGSVTMRAAVETGEVLVGEHGRVLSGGALTTARRVKEGASRRRDPARAGRRCADGGCGVDGAVGRRARLVELVEGASAIPRRPDAPLVGRRAELEQLILAVRESAASLVLPPRRRARRAGDRQDAARRRARRDGRGRGTRPDGPLCPLRARGRRTCRWPTSSTRSPATTKSRHDPRVARGRARRRAGGDPAGGRALRRWRHRQRRRLLGEPQAARDACAERAAARRARGRPLGRADLPRPRRVPRGLEHGRPDRARLPRPDGAARRTAGLGDGRARARGRSRTTRPPSCSTRSRSRSRSTPTRAPRSSPRRRAIRSSSSSSPLTPLERAARARPRPASLESLLASRLDTARARRARRARACRRRRARVHAGRRRSALHARARPASCDRADGARPPASRPARRPSDRRRRVPASTTPSIRDATYAAVAKTERARLHEQLARWLDAARRARRDRRPPPRAGGPEPARRRRRRAHAGRGSRRAPRRRGRARRLEPRPPFGGRPAHAGDRAAPQTDTRALELECAPLDPDEVLGESGRALALLRHAEARALAAGNRVSCFARRSSRCRR